MIDGCTVRDRQAQAISGPFISCEAALTRQTLATTTNRTTGIAGT